MRGISSLLCLAFLLATDASAQLASQTALVGTVTDSADLVVPGAQVVAVNTGTRIPTRRRRTRTATTTSSSCAAARTKSRSRFRFPDVQSDGRRGRQQPGHPHQCGR